jgi:hypothetical protein
VRAPCEQAFPISVSDFGGSQDLVGGSFFSVEQVAPCKNRFLPTIFFSLGAGRKARLRLFVVLSPSSTPPGLILLVGLQLPLSMSVRSCSPDLSALRYRDPFFTARSVCCSWCRLYFPPSGFIPRRQVPAWIFLPRYQLLPQFVSQLVIRVFSVLGAGLLICFSIAAMGFSLGLLSPVHQRHPGFNL